MKKEKALILEVSSCDTNLYPDGPVTLTEAKKIGRDRCPFLSNCQDGGLSRTGRQCAMLHGVHVARYALRGNHSVSVEMKDFRREMKGKISQAARNGIIWSKDRTGFEVIKDITKGIDKIEEFAKMVLGEVEPNEPKKIKRSFKQLVANATDKKGAIDSRKIEAAEGSCGSNGGRGCDVTEGPCSCGAWH